ncbi:uncharacterized protein [Primulina eburnea]|uniref:uncharacterized protein n=1 Tax=Primulina eburnea TaxID=1245227 RepID=UPI003C6C5564
MTGPYISPAMNELRAVTSTYHQKIKFPVGAQMGEVQGEQPSSRKFYVEAVRADQSKTRRESKKSRVDEVERGVAEKGGVHFVAEEEHEELAGISSLISEHHLNILPGSHPVKQKKRHFSPEKDNVIDEQLRDLLKAGHIREIQFPTWLLNVVLVPKSIGKWRMCVDLRDLNKACPKDHYPLPRIDQLVDFTSGFELLSFMDAYQEYHQIPLAKNDQDKASFITLGDNILGKSKEVADFITDLEETFATLMYYGIKLNPDKYIFGVKSGLKEGPTIQVG